MNDGKTLGQIACEALWRHLGTGPDGSDPAMAWAWAGSMSTREAWEVAALAVLDRARSFAGVQDRPEAPDAAPGCNWWSDES